MTNSAAVILVAGASVPAWLRRGACAAFSYSCGIKERAWPAAGSGTIPRWTTGRLARWVALLVAQLASACSGGDSVDGHDLANGDHAVVEVRRHDFGGDLRSVFRLCACGHGSVFESTAEPDDPEPWTQPFETTFVTVESRATTSVLERGDDLLASIGDGESLSVGAWTHLTRETVAVFDPSGRRHVGTYWHGAYARTAEEVEQSVRVVEELEPDFPAEVLDGMRRISSYSVHLRTVLLDAAR